MKLAKCCQNFDQFTNYICKKQKLFINRYFYTIKIVYIYIYIYKMKMMFGEFFAYDLLSYND